MGFQTAAREDAVTALAECRPFAHRGLRLMPGAYLGDDHQLPQEQERAYRAAMDAQRIVVTVYSYATPIAWVTRDGGERLVTVPQVFYSRTTSGHQNLVREHLR